jgi:hypothetical protein
MRRGETGMSTTDGFGLRGQRGSFCSLGNANAISVLPAGTSTYCRPSTMISR